MRSLFPHPWNKPLVWIRSWLTYYLMCKDTCDGTKTRWAQSVLCRVVEKKQHYPFCPNRPPHTRKRLMIVLHFHIIFSSVTPYYFVGSVCRRTFRELLSSGYLGYLRVIDGVIFSTCKHNGKKTFFPLLPRKRGTRKEIFKLFVVHPCRTAVLVLLRQAVSHSYCTTRAVVSLRV